MASTSNANNDNPSNNTITGSTIAAGDTLALYSSVKNATSPEGLYNRHILAPCVQKGTYISHKWMDVLDEKANDLLNLKKRRRRDDWITTYNKSLTLLSLGDTAQSLNHVWTKLGPIVSTGDNDSNTNSKKLLTKELTSIACRMAFLALEGILSYHSIPTRRTTTVEDGDSDEDVAVVNQHETILTWLSKSIENSLDDDMASFKFQLSLYKGRLDFLERHDDKLVDAKIRSCRKELKHAMEIFQHKLRPSNAANQTSDAQSLASSSALSADNSEKLTMSGGSGSNANSNNNRSDEPELNKVLQRQNSAALNLKANTEQLKGNLKKSLILLAEAAPNSSDESSSPTTPTIISTGTEETYEESLHCNNLGVVYSTSGKHHLALLSFHKAMKLSQDQKPKFQKEGTVCLKMKSQIYYNAAIGALRTQNYVKAYQYLSSILNHSTNQDMADPKTNKLNSIWTAQPRSWVRLAEACIGIGTQLKQMQSGSPKLFKIPIPGLAQDEDTGDNKMGGSEKEKEESKEAADSKPPKFQGILLESSTLNVFDPKGLRNGLGSEEDLEQVRRSPFTRAKWALDKAVKLFQENQRNVKAGSPRQDGDDENSDPMGMSNAVLSLAYVCLEQKNYKAALHNAEWVLKLASTSDLEKMDSIRRSLVKRQLATARMYASEAACVLGKKTKSLQHLVGDGKEDAFERLASDLAGVTMASASKNAEGKARLAKAQASVRCSASIASCDLGNLAAAKQLAMSARAMEDAFYHSSSSRLGGKDREGSLARRALVYCNLREKQVQQQQQQQVRGGMMLNTNPTGIASASASGNSGLTFTLLRSAR